MLGKIWEINETCMISPHILNSSQLSSALQEQVIITCTIWTGLWLAGYSQANQMHEIKHAPKCSTHTTLIQ